MSAPSGGPPGTERSDESTPLLALFAKPPVSGTAKTRLAPVLGEAGAARLAGAFLTDALALLRPLESIRLVIASTGAFEPPWDRVVEGVPCWDQGSGHLGQRMERILARGLSEGASSAIALGADVPGLSVMQVEGAVRLLERHDAVLCPAHDGGYYLVGLRRCPTGVFEEIPWSVSETFERTAARFQSLGLSVAVGEPFFDVDEPIDLERLAGDLRAGRSIAPETARVLRELGVLG